MMIPFWKYHALGNDFLVIEASGGRLQRRHLGEFARRICDRRRGVGADGILYVTRDRRADCAADVYNADGSWAEKSGNGLRITAVHLLRGGSRASEFRVRMGGEISRVRLARRIAGGYMVKAELGKPDFRASAVPVRSRSKFVVNYPIRIGKTSLPVTCLSVGNPHTVLVVDDFNFNWKELGREIEKSRLFPHATNVEFVKVVSRRKVQVNDWERGAGATGSSGTGAAASVCAAVMLGLTERKCEVQFETGSLLVHWIKDSQVIELTGPVQFVGSGVIEFLPR